MEAFEPATEGVTPAVEVDTHIGRMTLHWFNTRLRLFPEDRAEFNHVEFYDDSDPPVLHAVANIELMDTLFEMNYPVLSLPFIDAHTMTWYVDLEVRDIDSELDGLTP